MSANPLKLLSMIDVKESLQTASPDLRQYHGRQAGLHEEPPGLSSGDEPVLGPHGRELLHVTHPLLGKDHPRIHAG